MLIRASGEFDARKFFLPGLKILLDGKPVWNVLDADDEAGYVVRYVTDAAGKLVEDGDRFKTERLEGTVVFDGTRRESDIDRRAAAQTRRDLRQVRNARNAARSQGGAA